SPWFLLGCLLSCGFAVVWLLLMRSMKLATTGLIYAIASTLLLVVVGTVIFGERLAPRELAGIPMALRAPALLGPVAVAWGTTLPGGAETTTPAASQASPAATRLTPGFPGFR